MTMDHQPVDGQLELPFEHSRESYKTIEAIYTVNIHMHRNGHVCSSLSRISMGGRQVVSETLGCSQAPGATRLAALRAAQSAVTEAIHDAVHEGA